jgi:hypothetical protein
MKQVLVGFALLGALGLSSVSYAFDTGHHADLTREAMIEFGFSDDAIGVAQVDNWLVDYYTNRPLAGMGSELGKLHFDNLATPAAVQNYWGRLTINTKSAVQAAADRKDPLQIVALMGMSLHAVQDFYSHSNWVEMQRPIADPASYGTRIWFDPPALLPPGAPPLPPLITGRYPTPLLQAIRPFDHGNYMMGMNHDSYVRPRWDEAYVYGYAASRQWIDSIRSWVNARDPRLWQKVQALTLTQANRAALTRDLDAAHHVSEWIALPGNDGHWKGSGSGALGWFTALLLQWGNGDDSIFVRHFKADRLYLPLTNTLRGDIPPDVALPRTAVPLPLTNKKVVRIRTLGVVELPGGAGEARVNNGIPNYYARVTIEGQTFIDSMQNTVGVGPAWKSLKVVGVAAPYSVVHYELLSQGANEHVLCDINPIVTRTTLDFRYLFPTPAAPAGSVIGDIAGGSGVLIITGGVVPDPFRAQVQLVIDSARLMR